VGLISDGDYRESIENALLFLVGKVDKLMKIAQKKMQDTALKQQFEQAARWRDLIRTLEQIKVKPRLISLGRDNRDIFGFARDKRNAALFVFLMREGRVIESFSFLVPKKRGTSDAEILAHQLLDFYKDCRDAPEKILLPFALSDNDVLAAEIARLTGKKARIHTPLRGKNRGLVALAVKNAEIFLREKSEEQHPFTKLRELFGLEKLPHRIEGFDISNTGGDESVGSLVVFEDGEPRKQDYRKYRIKTVEGPDDVASLKEVIRRRYKRLLEERRDLPGLILVDGGKGQLNAARNTLIELGLGDLPVLSLAKREETVFSPQQKQGIKLERTSPALRLLQRIRDEAHRFAITFHRQRREKKSFSSVLDGIPGIGKKRKAILLEKYKSTDAIKKVSPEELEKIVGKKAARELLIKIRSEK
jgi:excinuclease ABC subunit C